MVSALVHVTKSGTAVRDCAVGIGLDSITVNSAWVFGGAIEAVSINSDLSCFYSGYPSAGRHYLVWLERSETGGTTTWNGTLASGSGVSGIMGELMG